MLSWVLGRFLEMILSASALNARRVVVVRCCVRDSVVPFQYDMVASRFEMPGWF